MNAFIRYPNGLGDTVMMRPIVEHLSREWDLRVPCLPDYKEIFDGLPVKVCTFGDGPERGERLLSADYMPFKARVGTTQFEDMCQAAGIKEPVPLRFPSVARPARLEVRTSKPICLIKHPCYKNYGNVRFKDLSPEVGPFERVIEAYQGKWLFIQVGKRGEDLYKLKGIDIDLVGALSVMELMWLVQRSDMVVTRVGHMLPMAEALGRRCFVVWGGAMLRSKDRFLATITPDKVINKPALVGWARDDDERFMQRFERYAGN